VLDPGREAVEAGVLLQRSRMSSTSQERMTETWFQLSNTAAGRSSETPERSSNSTPSAIGCTIPNSIAL
jgi:hypothetical protein